MADIKIPTIITAEDYKTHYPADNYEIPKINQAITMAYETINYKYTANEIGRRWDLDQDKGGFTEEEKVHIQEAFFVQSRYNLQTGLQAQKNTLQRSSGSQNVSIAIPQRDSVYETVIYCLELAHVTTMLQGASFGVNGLGCSEFDFARFVTWDKGNQVYVKNQYIDTEEAEFKKNTVLTYDNNAGSYWIRFSDFAKQILPTFKKGNLYYNGKTLEWLDTDTYLKSIEGYGLGRTLTVVNVGTEEKPEYAIQWTFGQGVSQEYVDTQDSLVFKNSKEYTDDAIKGIETNAVWGKITGTLKDQEDLYTILENKAEKSELPTKVSDLTNDSGFITADYHDSTKQDTISDLETIRTNANLVNTKQDTLVNQQNIKSINGESLLGSGNIEVGGGDLPTPPEAGSYVLTSIDGQLQWTYFEVPFQGLCFTAQQDNSSISYQITGSLPDINIQYSYNGSDWHNWSVEVSNRMEMVKVWNPETNQEEEKLLAVNNSNETISLMSGEKLYVRNTTNTLSTSNSNFFKFVMTGKISASGNANSMINNAELSNYCYSYMFHSCTSLTTAPKLPATELSNYCYRYMFRSCTSLTTAPNLPATTLVSGCYDSMFSGCSQLKVNENGTGKKIFTCPSTIPTFATTDMFYATGGTFTGTPTAGNTYNWYN